MDLGADAATRDVDGFHFARFCASDSEAHDASLRAADSFDGALEAELDHALSVHSEDAVARLEPDFSGSAAFDRPSDHESVIHG